jgi:hypothetical protein
MSYHETANLVLSGYFYRGILTLCNFVYLIVSMHVFEACFLIPIWTEQQL